MARLKRQVTLWEAVMYGLCVIVGAGIYALVGVAAGEAGNGVWLSFLFAALIAGCTGLSYAELSSKMPHDAAEFEYTERAFRSRRLAFGITWLKMAGAIIAMATVSLGFAGYFSKLFGLPPLFGALLIVGLSTLLNALGAKNTMRASAFFVAITITGLLVVVLSGIPRTGSVDYFDLSFGWGGVFSAAALIFFAFLGFENIADLGEEIKNPRKMLPLALLLSILISTVIYVAVSFISISVVPWQELAASASPLSLVAEATLGGYGSILLTIIALFATGSTIFGIMFAYSRLLFGMAEDHCLPKSFMRLSRKGVPYISVLTIGAVTGLMVLVQDIRFVAMVADFSALFVFMAINVALIALRYEKDHLHGEFNVPLNIGRFPVLPALGAVFCLFMLTKLGALQAVLSLLALLAGILVYMFGFEKKVCKTRISSYRQP
ncbi:MAG: amino acid permease [Candidatus Aenigmatarchaeota archaeon]